MAPGVPGRIGCGDEQGKLVGAWRGESGDEPALYPVTMVGEPWRVWLSTAYVLRGRVRRSSEADRGSRMRGPMTTLSGDDLVPEIRTVLKPSPFLFEGATGKVRGSLAATGIRGANNRLLLRKCESTVCWPRCVGAIPAGSGPTAGPDPNRAAGRSMGQG